METRILLIGEVAALMRVANVTIYRWLSESRSGRGNFPLPISRRKAKLRWLAADIDQFMKSQSIVTPVFVGTSSAAKQTKDYQRRQDAARAALARHGIKR